MTSKLVVGRKLRQLRFEEKSSFLFKFLNAIGDCRSITLI